MDHNSSDPLMITLFLDFPVSVKLRVILTSSDQKKSEENSAAVGNSGKTFTLFTRLSVLNTDLKLVKTEKEPF